MTTEDALLDVYGDLRRALDGCVDSEGDSEYTALQHVKMESKAEGIALCMEYVHRALLVERGGKRERRW